MYGAGTHIVDLATIDLYLDELGIGLYMVYAKAGIEVGLWGDFC